MKNKNVQIALLALFILVGGGLLYYGLNDNSNEAQGERTAQTVEIIKYSDYQCPACRQGYELLKPLVQEFGDKVVINYRHFPLSGFQFSRLAAHAAEAARNQGKFNDMHVLIFESQQQWSQGNADQYFTQFAEEIGLDMEQFREDIESEEVAERVESNRQEGIRRTVNATPTYFMNGQKIQQNPQTYEQLKALVELYMYRS
jgi:protein-disulfide isomerase